MNKKDPKFTGREKSRMDAPQEEFIEPDANRTKDSASRRKAPASARPAYSEPRQKSSRH